MQSGRHQQPPLFDDLFASAGAPAHGAPPHPAVSYPTDPPIDLRRSARRRRTYKWSLVGGRVQLEVPLGLRHADESRIVAEVAERARKRLLRSTGATSTELYARARDLARRYLPEALPRLRAVSWSERQERRWGSCSSDTGSIRLSVRLQGLPDYVLDAVLMHEIAHLLEPNHSDRFHALAGLYPLAERARGFLEAVDRRLLEADADWDDALD